jgi:hypothetical protein
MEGNVAELVGTWLFVIGGFIVGVAFGRLILTIF